MSGATPGAVDVRVSIFVDGRELQVAAGTSVAAAMLDAGLPVFRRSVHGDARGPLCGMGVCYECRVTADGVPLRRACLLPAREGLRVSTTGET